MRTVAQALEAFISSIQPTESEEEQAIRQRELLRGHLEGGLTLAEFLPSGSFKRQTAIHPLNDIDLFVVLDAAVHRDLKDSGPRATLRRVARVLEDAYPNKDKPKTQTHSLNVEFVGTGLAYDIVPAFLHEVSGYVIPDRDAQTWIRTNPRKHAEHATAANERAGKKAKPIVKALKRWNCLQATKVVRSFHLELMVYDALSIASGSYAEGIATALRHAASRIIEPMPEPAGVGPDVDQGMTLQERVEASDALGKAADIAAKALAAASDGRTGDAHYHWRSLFGRDYPEAGTKPSTPTSSSGFTYGGPDPKPRRFG